MITEFRDRYFFLSNFHPASLVYEGTCFPSVEHAYQAMKTHDVELRRRIARLSSPSEAKAMGRDLVIRSDWNEVRNQIMLYLVRLKFEHMDLRFQLLMTMGHDLIEGNRWHDIYWGVCNCATHQGNGTNQLGKILMQVRDELKHSWPVLDCSLPAV